MSGIEAIYANGVFKPLANVSLPENQRVRLTVETALASSVDAWLTAVQSFQQQLLTTHGIFPDSTTDIAADRRRHE